jgi:hypothetical protein
MTTDTKSHACSMRMFFTARTSLCIDHLYIHMYVHVHGRLCMHKCCTCLLVSTAIASWLINYRCYIWNVLAVWGWRYSAGGLTSASKARDVNDIRNLQTCCMVNVHTVVSRHKPDGLQADLLPLAAGNLWHSFCPGETSDTLACIVICSSEGCA